MPQSLFWRNVRMVYCGLRERPLSKEFFRLDIAQRTVSHSLLGHCDGLSAAAHRPPRDLRVGIALWIVIWTCDVICAHACALTSWRHALWRHVIMWRHYGRDYLSVTWCFQTGTRFTMIPLLYAFTYFMDYADLWTCLRQMDCLSLLTPYIC